MTPHKAFAKPSGNFIKSPDPHKTVGNPLEKPYDTASNL